MLRYEPEREKYPQSREKSRTKTRRQRIYRKLEREINKGKQMRMSYEQKTQVINGEEGYRCQNRRHDERDK